MFISFLMLLKMQQDKDVGFKQRLHNVAGLQQTEFMSAPFHTLDESLKSCSLRFKVLSHCSK